MSDTAEVPWTNDRDSVQVVREAAARLAARQTFFGILDAFPSAAFILNQKRQVLYANPAALEAFGVDLVPSLGRRPGEILQCENADKTPLGCGSAQACRVCGIVNAVYDAQSTGKQTKKEAELTLGKAAGLRSMDLSVTVTPFHDGSEDLLIVAFEDLSHKKRREVIERIFFHDVLNTLSVLQSSAELLRSKPEEKEYIEYILSAAFNLEEEITRHRDLRSMERGELMVDVSECSSLGLLHRMVVEFSLAEFARDKTFILDGHRSMDRRLSTDPLLLRRVLGNMIKNALEATKPGESVRAATREEDGEVLFEVSNPAFIAPDDQLRVFHRSFTTKGRGRGIGTYSMRLITENYLLGRIGFESTPESGTRFWIRLPRSSPVAD